MLSTDGALSAAKPAITIDSVQPWSIKLQLHSAIYGLRTILFKFVDSYLITFKFAK